MSIDKGKCPVCGGDVNVQTSYEDPYLLSEEYIECASCGYSYNYSYGHTESRVGGEVFTWGWEGNDQNNNSRLACDKAIEAERQKRVLNAQQQATGGIR